MYIRDLTEHPIELTTEEQRQIVGGLGWFILGSLAAVAIDRGYDAIPDKIDTTEVNDHVIAGAIKGRGRGRGKGKE